MSRFYNMDSGQLDQMPVDEFEVYWQEITKLEAQEMLLAITIVDYPHLKGNQRSQVYNRIKNHASDQKQKILSTQDIAKVIGAIDGR